MSIAALVQRFPIVDGRVVVDKTGMKGRYDIPDVSLDIGPLEPRGRDPLAESWPKIIQQLGLKLEPGRAPVEVLIIDRLEKPSEN